MKIRFPKFLLTFGSLLLLNAPIYAAPPAHSGITTNSDGTYSFSRLHVGTDGKIYDERNEEVYILGINAINPFEGNAGARNLVLPEFQASKPANLVRVNFNTRWLAEDAYVPDQKMHFKQWLNQIVATLEKNGFYVELDAGPCFWEPPAGNDHNGVNITLSPHQNQGSLDYQADPSQHNAEGMSSYQPIALQALQYVATTYGNDPAVLINVWNEPLFTYYGTGNQAKNQLFANMNERINLVRSIAPDTVIVVYSNSIRDMLSGAFPLYAQKNLILDFHCYNLGNAQHAEQLFQQLHSKGFGIMYGEWGGKNPDLGYVNSMLTIAQANHVGLVYFELVNLVDKTGTLNAFGTTVFNGYQNVFGN